MSTAARQGSSSLQLGLCVLSIYAAYLTWALLQERIATTPYGPDKQIFRASFVLNTAQSLAATVTGSLYLLLRSGSPPPSPPQKKSSLKALITSIYPTRQLFFKFAIIAATSSLASPFGYASLKYIDYPTQILGKSCKLLPVMALGVLLYGRSFPAHKYLVVLMVTTGVALFTLFNPHAHAKKTGAGAGGEGGGGKSVWGLCLLSVNLLLDGFTNSSQDQLFLHHPRTTSGPSMMVALNLLSSLFTTLFLLSRTTSELSDALTFMHTHPSIVSDIFLFAICGAIGQVAIFYTLEKFGSLVLVTVTLTRKMGTMLVSVVWFGHALSVGQAVGVVLVFGGISAEALMKRFEEARKKEKSGKKVQ